MDANNFFSAAEFPHSIEAEQSVIGAVLADPTVMPTVIEKIKPDYFYSESHRKIFGIIYRMFTGGSPIDPVTVLNEVEKTGIFEHVFY